MTQDFVKIIHQKDNFISLWIVFLVFFIISFLFIGLKKYEQSTYFVGYFENNCVNFLIDETRLINLPNEVYLNNKKYNYTLQSVSSDYVLENNIRYRLVTLLTDFKTNSSVVDVKFMYEKTYLFNEILKIIKGG